MALQNNTSNITNSTTNSTPRSAKSSDSDTLRPHYYTTFQNYCCGPKSNSSTSTPIKGVLPIPEKFKSEAENLLNIINGILIENLTRITKYTNIIPHDFFKKYDYYDIQRYLIDRLLFRTMTDAHIINWIPSLKMLYPIRTSGNGNCLLHSVLIAMVGIHDLNLYLRDRLAQFMDENKDILKNHWRIERLKSDRIYGISSEDSKLDEEWDELCNLVHYENNENGQTATNLEYLEAVHIFSISNMLCRPIIVLSEDVIRNKVGEAISVNDLFGIYLPTLSSPNDCTTVPIILAYDRSHFCALLTDDISDERSLENLLPLYLSVNHAYEKTLLPIRFLGDDGNIEHTNNLLQDYLKIKQIDVMSDPRIPLLSIKCAQLGSKHLRDQDNLFSLYHKYLIDFVELQKPKAIEDELKLKKQYEQSKYATNENYYDNKDRPMTIELPSLSSSSTPKSVRSNATSYDIQSSYQNNDTYRDRYVYDGAYTTEAYVPYQMGMHIENPIDRSQQSQRSLEPIKPVRTDLDINSSHIRTSTKSNINNSANNITNLNSSDKYFNSVNSTPRQDELRSTTEQRKQPSVVTIPVHYMTPTAVSNNNQTLFISEDRYGSNRQCMLCDKPLNQSDPRHFCSKCELNIHPTTDNYDTRTRPHSQTYRTNVNLSRDDHRPTSTLLTTPRNRINRLITCPHCGSKNLNTGVHTSNYSCSACKFIIDSKYLFHQM